MQYFETLLVKAVGLSSLQTIEGLTERSAIDIIRTRKALFLDLGADSAGVNLLGFSCRRGCQAQPAHAPGDQGYISSVI